MGCRVRRNVHEIRVFREGQEVDVHNAPSSLFGDEENAGSKSTADHRAVEAAVLAYLRRFVIEHDAEEWFFLPARRLLAVSCGLAFP